MHFLSCQEVISLKVNQVANTNKLAEKMLSKYKEGRLGSLEEIRRKEIILNFQDWLEEETVQFWADRRKIQGSLGRYEEDTGHFGQMRGEYRAFCTDRRKI
jgi:hypothetical protein